MDKREIGIGFIGLVGIAYVVSNGMMLADFIKGRKDKSSKGESFEADETVCLMCGDYKDPKKAYCCGDCSGYANQRVNPLGGKSGGGFPRGDIAKAVLTLKEYGGEMSANQWKARIRDIRPTRKELNTNEIHKLVNYLNPDIYIKTPGKIITYQITGGNCYDEWAKERYQAESFDAELKRDSCCCGATVETPCLCMVEGVMECSAGEPKCPCYAAKDAESFEAEGLLFDDGGERYGQGFITTNEEIYKERLIQYVLESNFAEYYYPVTEEELAEGYPEGWGDTVEEHEAANNQLKQWLSGKSIDELTSFAGGYARTKDVDLDKGWVEMWGNRKGLETDYHRGRHAESFEAERKPNQCMHCNEVLYEIEVWEDFRCPHCNNSIGDIYSDEISYDDYMSAESFEAQGGDSVELIAPILDYHWETDSPNTEITQAERNYIDNEMKYLSPAEWGARGKGVPDAHHLSIDIERDGNFYTDIEGEWNVDWEAESFGAEAQDNIEKMIHFLKTGDAKGLSIPWEYDNQGQVVIYTGCTMKENGEVIEMTYCEQCGSPEWSDGGCTNEGNCELAMNAESFEAPGEMEEEDFTPMDITQCHVCARPYEYSRIARALVQHYLKESKDGTMGWKTKGNPDGTRRTVRNIAGYQLYWFGLGALENYLEEGKISKMTPMVIELLRTAIVPNIIAGDVVQFIESMEIDDIEDTDPKFFTDFSDTWEAPDDRLKPERPSDDSGDRSKYRKKPRKPWRAENEPSE